MIIMHQICDRCKKEEIISDVQKNYSTSCGGLKYIPYGFPKYMISTSDENGMYKEINLCEECERKFEAFLTEFDIPKTAKESESNKAP